MLAAWRAALLALCVVVLPQRIGAQQAPSAEPPPTWPSDTCHYFESADGLRFLFDTGAATLSHPRMRELLDVAFAGWREDKGFVLLEAHTNGTEAQAGADGLDLRRAEFVRDELVARGIPERIIWIKALGYSSPLVPLPIGTPEVQNRRVVMRNTTRGRAYYNDRCRVRREWFERNCFPTLRSDAATCLEVLEAIQIGSE